MLIKSTKTDFVHIPVNIKAFTTAESKIRFPMSKHLTSQNQNSHLNLNSNLRPRTLKRQNEKQQPDLPDPVQYINWGLFIF